MDRILTSFFIVLVLNGVTKGAEDEPVKTNPEDTKMIKAIFDEALVSGDTYRLLEYLSTQIGHRLSGSEGAAKAVEWTKQVMEEFGFDRVFLQEVMVPHWERGGKERATIVGAGVELSVLALGGSIGTPEEGITAEVIEVDSVEAVAQLGREKIEGKIVFYNGKFDQSNIRSFASYGRAVAQRVRGASEAAAYGAKAVVIRSVTSAFDDVPHTGSLRYDEKAPKIPAAALGVQSSDRLSGMLARGEVQLTLTMGCRWLPDAKSHNVIGELTGQEFPEEIIVVGGHLDSWDVGHGAHDDGAGCMHAIMALRTLQKLGIKPRRTLRAVMFMNEENGVRGGEKYAELAKEQDEKHLIAIESDAGGFVPRGFGVSAPVEVIEKIRSWLPHFDKNTISYINKGGGGVDIRPLNRAQGVPTIGLIPDSQRYFDLHHSENDRFETVNRRELELGTAAIASLIYLIDTYGF